MHLKFFIFQLYLGWIHLHTLLLCELLCEFSGQFFLGQLACWWRTGLFLPVFILGEVLGFRDEVHLYEG